jgi:uncharacterized protein with HEPN domain
MPPRKLWNLRLGNNGNILYGDRKLTFAIIKSIEIIGEAASKVTETCRAENDNIPWKDGIGMHNRLTHGYFDVNLDVVWETIQTDTPDLIKILKKIIVKQQGES